MSVADKKIYVAGLDVGRSNERTALAVVERTEIANQQGKDRPIYQHAVRHLQRFAIGTPYNEICDALRDMFSRQPLKGSVLVADVTAVGQPVLDTLRQSNIGAGLVLPVNITGGQTAGIGG